MDNLKGIKSVAENLSQSTAPTTNSNPCSPCSPSSPTTASTNVAVGSSVTTTQGAGSDGATALSVPHYAGDYMLAQAVRLDCEWRGFYVALEHRSRVLQMTVAFHKLADQVYFHFLLTTVVFMYLLFGLALD